MKKHVSISLVVVSVTLIAASLGFLGHRYQMDAEKSGMALADATTYRSGVFRISTRIIPETPQVGGNRLLVKVADDNGNPVTGANIQAYGEMPAMGAMSAMRAPADLEEGEPGLYAGPLYLEMGGEWPLTLHVHKAGIGETRLGFDMATGRPGLRIASGGTPVANTMARSERSAEGQAMTTKAGTIEPDARGFYTVGPYQLKLEVPNGATLVTGENRLQAVVRDLDGNAVQGARVRAVAQRVGADGQPQGNTPVMALEAVGGGVYRGALVLEQDGEYTLAVDVADEALGHGDLVLAFSTGEAGLTTAAATPEGIAYYTCAMHGSVREAGPGQCPICSMDLVPVTREEVDSGVITVDARRRQLIGVQTGQTVLRSLVKRIRAVGRIGYDERRISNVSLKFNAWIGDLMVDYVGARVERGQVLFTVYSPELLSAQQEYLETRRRLASRGADDSLLQAARKRLMLWDITPAQVRALERRGEAIEYLPIHAPKSGTVVGKMVVEGSHMKTGDMLLRIADLSTVWVDAEVYEAELPLIEPGMAATVTLPYMPDARYEARVDYVYPYLEDKTRTARIRLVLDNPDGRLKPDMYAEVDLQVDLGKRLVVPEEAVLVAGESRVVFKDMGEEGKLKPMRVETGQRVDNYIEVTKGLSAGDRVITSGNFLIAAEARLKTGIEQW